MIPDTAADTRNHQNERYFKTSLSISHHKMYLLAYTLDNTTYIEISLEANGTTEYYSEVYLPHRNQTLKQINHSVMHSVLGRFSQRPLAVYYTLSQLDNHNVAIKPDVTYIPLAADDNPLSEKLKNRIREAQ